MKKHVPNLLTGSRLLLCLPLLFLPLSSPWFALLYLLCGFTDMIDGTVAGLLGATSEFGAKLDTVSDLAFVLVSAARILPRIYLPVGLWVWIALIALLKIGSAARVFLRRRTVLSIHSALNRATGLALFLFPLSLTFIKPAYGVCAICALATAAAVQEAYFIAKGRDYTPNGERAK